MPDPVPREMPSLASAAAEFGRPLAVLAHPLASEVQVQEVGRGPDGAVRFVQVREQVAAGEVVVRTTLTTQRDPDEDSRGMRDYSLRATQAELLVGVQPAAASPRRHAGIVKLAATWRSADGETCAASLDGAVRPATRLWHDRTASLALEHRDCHVVAAGPAAVIRDGLALRSFPAPE